MRTILIAILLAGCVAEPDDPGTAVSADTVPRDGVDYSWGRPSPTGLRDLGFTFAARYLSWNTTGKNLSAPEAAALHAAGLDVVLVFEESAGAPLDGYGAGVAHAQRAREMIAELGAPANQPVYFAVDFQVVAAQWPAVEAYFDGVAAVLPRPQIGAYGGIGTIAHLFDTGRIAYGWQTYAWSHGQWDPRAQLHQVSNGQDVAGGLVDLDVALAADFGQWPATPAPPVASTWTTCGVLRIGEVLGADRPLPSCDGRYFLAQQTDGNLVLYRHDGTPRWASGTAGSAGDRTIMQGDGNAVLYTAHGTPLWHSNTWGHAGAQLFVQDDGNLVVYAADGTPLWASGTNE